MKRVILYPDLFQHSIPRGIRNNNPLNLKYSSRNNWKNQTGSDGIFCTFSDFRYGIRAAWKNMQTILNRCPDQNIGQFIYTWCPDNTAKSYTISVLKAIGYASEDDNDLYNIIKRTLLSDIMLYFPVELVRSMIEVENGYCPYSDNDILYSIHLK